MKYEWRKQAKEQYLPKQTPVSLTIPSQRFIAISGTGDPNGQAFRDRLEVLYPMAYGIKAAYRKAAAATADYDDFTVFPLEGVWDLSEKGRQLDHLDKKEFVYDIMIAIPDFVPDDVVAEAIETTKAKKPNPLQADLKILTTEETQVVQCLHIGAYDDEPATFAKMQAYCDANGLNRTKLTHREIYLSDARRVAPDKLKTVLRFQVAAD